MSPENVIILEAGHITTSNKLTTDLIDEEPGGEEESDAEEDEGEVREHGGVDGGHVASHGADIGNSHDGWEIVLKYWKIKALWHTIHCLNIKYHIHCKASQISIVVSEP